MTDISPDSIREQMEADATLAAHVDKVSALLAQRANQLTIALEWAMDLIDLYDSRLEKIDGAEKVYTPAHIEAKARVRRLIDAVEAEP